MIRGSLNVRAVQQNDSLHGFTRINHFLRGTHKIRGICGEFTATQGFQDIDYGNGLDRLFFYGVQEDLTENYRNGDKARSMQRIFQDNIIYYPKNTDDGRQISFGKIPVAKLDLTKEQIDLIDDIIAYASYFLKNSKKVKYVRMPKEGSPLRTIKSSLSRMFPPGLLELVESAGGYWDLTESIRLSNKFPNSSKNQSKTSSIPSKANF
ncbi:MAG: hypothetical protein AABW71_00315 [Nanoarchaeota archaeon]